MNVSRKSILDGLLRFDLDPTLLRGQTFDGGSNMDGKYKGCQAMPTKNIRFVCTFDVQLIQFIWLRSILVIHIRL